MTSEENVEAARRWFTDGWTGNLELAEEIFSPELRTNGVLVGREGPKRNNRNRLVGFPDVRVGIEEIFAAGDRVVIRILWSGTHTGEYSGVPPTGKAVRVPGIAVWRFSGGKVVEIWSIQDQFSLLQQIGVIPPEVGAAQVRPGPA